MQVQLFGAFRDLETSGKCEILYQVGQSAQEIKALIFEVLKNESSIDLEALMKISVLASENQIYNDDDIPTHFESLAILPPVCGG